MSPRAGAMAGAGDSPQGLSERQRQLVAGTFRVMRDQEEGDSGTAREDLATLALGQGRLREQVEGLVQQMERRGAMAMDSAFAIIMTYAIARLLRAVMGLRVADNEEEVGLDISEHGERAYA